MKKILSFLLVLALCLGLTGPVLGADPEPEAATGPLWRKLRGKNYYPVTQTENWAEMSRAERVASCQLSDETMDTMPTQELLWAVLNYPFMIDMYAFNNYRTGFLHVYSEFPALAGLADRADLGAALVETYEAIPVATGKEDADNYIFELAVLEILAAQPEMTNGLTQSELEQLVRTAAVKYEEKSATSDINGGHMATFYEAAADSPDSAVSRAIIAAAE